MTQSVDNTAASIPGVIRDPVTAANLLRVNADGSINVTGGGGGSVSVTAGAGIKVTPTPLTGTGTIAAAPIAPVNASGATQALTTALFGSTVLLNRALGCAVALPAATGSGGFFYFMVKTVSVVGYTIARAGSDTIDGWITLIRSSDGAFFGMGPATGSVLITLNGTTQGGAAIGDSFTMQDVASGIWQVTPSLCLCIGGPVSPFS